MALQSNSRILKEIKDIQQGSDLSLAVAFQDADVRHVRALIVGPPETPYEFGFFEFDFRFGKNYPSSAPEVKARTTNFGATRFNPNIYSNGKVCLSILGTWQGEPGEEWSSVQCLESVLLSIQSLMSANPYENEPGFENSKARTSDAAEAHSYAAKIHHESIRISVIKRLEEDLGVEGSIRAEGEASRLRWGEDEVNSTIWEPFSDFCKRRFLWYHSSYIRSIEAKIATRDTPVTDGTIFPQTSFESLDNGMRGSFNYSELRRRLAVIREALDGEEKQWVDAGAKALARESPVALSFQNTFRAVVHKFKDYNTPLDLSLINDNPFAWQMIIFGRPSTNLDGGIFTIKLVFSLNFPEEQPRVTVETPLFHHRISSDGVLCYFPAKPEEISSHIEAVIKAIEDEEPRYDPRAVVNPDAALLFWGNAEQKKLYNRKLRRSAQDSSEG